MSSGTTAVDRLLQAGRDAAAGEAAGAVLGALGMTASGTHRFDMAVLPIPSASADLAAVAASLGISIAEAATDLRKPGGLILRDLDGERAQLLERRLRGVRGIVVELSEPQSAVYDLFGPVDATVRRDLERLGLAACPVTGAAAAALDCGLADWLRRRHRRVALDRRFQRFDLMLCDSAQMPRERIADFIGLRAGVARSAVLSMSPTAPIRLETGLKRGAARHFAADYAAIGLCVRLRLSGAAA